MMKQTALTDRLWGSQAKLSTLLLVSGLLLFTFLGAREIWTQEHRWADIVAGMFYRHDYLHPYLGTQDYYDKPLLSYWMMAGIAAITGQLSTWALRLPSALAGLLAIWSIYRLGTLLKDKSLGLLSGWLLVSTFYFLFWARTSSADMLNVAGSLFAVTWYFEKRDSASFLDYTIFFLILALTGLCKGLVGMVVPAIVIMVDIAMQKSWLQYLRWRVWVAMVPGVIIYLLPFWASSHFSNHAYAENGLYLVYRENILRYFQPFDHEGPLYTYFVYLPIYMLPWAFLLIPALATLSSRWKGMSTNSKWIVWSLTAVFLFFTLSGSRRSYYVLPVVPFAILFIADWMLSVSATTKRYRWMGVAVMTAVIFLYAAVDVMPAWYYSHFGVNRFAALLKTEAIKTKPWQSWNVVMLDGESKLNFYLQLPPDTKNYSIKGDLRNTQTAATLAKNWPILAKQPSNTIFISREQYADYLKPYFTHYQFVNLPVNPKLAFLNKQSGNRPIAFIPQS